MADIDVDDLVDDDEEPQGEWWIPFDADVIVDRDPGDEQ